MSKTLRIAGCFCGMVLCSVCAGAETHHARKHSAAVAAPSAPPAAQVAQTPVVPEPPPTPEELPATPPKVVMSGGQLSIDAENSTLGDVLSAVKNLTGASVEAPGGANNERIAVNLGPGNPQQVLQELFSGSKFDYIILGSPTNASAIEKIILTNRGAGGASGGAIASAPNNGMNQMPARGGFQPPPTIPDQNDNAVDDEVTQPEPPPPQQEEVTPPQQDQQHIGPGGEAQQGPKTPEQLLQELQRMQQQQQQQGGPPQRPQR